ncbi:tyrosine-protein phosphatase [Nocardia sp. NEAU-G5]|uniref:Tyrosine-protein phosphatase n=1 Tax=Nocardia albiluteola TaxID=2842303 RepID=A0ABS6BCT4_9NOCA|nr:tyrosine-protein phosphatase [Nocardia albiluteola]MBU3068102.1 tyrosine-protein phosphatase [Nocardia albiluteola]
MNNPAPWIDLKGAVNVRDLGGLTTTSNGVTRYGRLLRAGSLQDLTADDVELLTRSLNVRDVVDLRSAAEVRRTGPGPLTHIPGVRIQQLSLFAEGGVKPRAATESASHPDKVDVGRALPWNTSAERGRTKPMGSTGHYLRYCTERPDSVVAALRIIARGTGATVVHCAVGKDRTGVVCALALEAVGVSRDAIVADYVRSGERITEIVARLRSNPLYAADMAARPLSSLVPRPAYMHDLLDAIDERFGGVRRWLTRHGWTEDDHRALRSHLLE